MTATSDPRAPDAPDRDAAALDLATVDRLVVVSAQPPDEVLGAGGLIRRVHDRGTPVEIVVASNGERTHPDSPTHPPERLWALHRDETARAVRTLAPGAGLRRLGLPHGALADHVPDLVAAVRDAVGAAGDRALIVTTWRDDGGPDHRAVARAAQTAGAATGAAVAEFPVRGWSWLRRDDPRVHPSRLAVLRLTDAEVLAKRRAVREHRSQIGPLGPAPQDRAALGPDAIERGDRAHELFLPVRRSLTAGYFTELYRAADDPWRLGGSWYEERKRALTAAALPRARFRSAFEPGCAVGLLTELLAPRCDRYLAADIAAEPLARVTQRLAGQDHVDVRRLTLPDQWPDGDFDLVVLSEVGYYLDHVDLSRVIERTVSALTPDGVVLACHWRHPAAGYPLTGDEVHAALAAEPGLITLAAHTEEDFRLDVFARPGTPSVARADGVLA
ncbi:bifunctional PIG-L family deacetylase/class I SAM-dependent methyltransferase [Nakamurella sp.]|uniref:bifunctional PIG-L family deacetylase/class I SAM-dependent methyltransferase n=1 Tax=Nakamurella sp. TaxID=1869182 RepID=UPI003B3B04E8